MRQLENRAAVLIVALVVSGLAQGPQSASAQEGGRALEDVTTSDWLTSGFDRVSSLHSRDGPETRSFVNRETDLDVPEAVEIMAVDVPHVLGRDDYTAHMFKNAAYRDSVLKRLEAERALAAAQSDAESVLAASFAAENDLARLVREYEGRSWAAIDADIQVLDPASPTMEAELSALTEERDRADAFETERAILVSTAAEAAAGAEAAMRVVNNAENVLASALAAETAALKAASNGRPMSEVEIAYFQARLGL
ncbi:MAG: hypothetical protein R3E44_01955 [Paracoccaceae bacterium]